MSSQLLFVKLGTIVATASSETTTSLGTITQTSEETTSVTFPTIKGTTERKLKKILLTDAYSKQVIKILIP